MRLTPKLVLPVLLVALSLAGAGYLRATKPKVDAEPEVEQIWSVRTAAIERRDHQPMLALFGELVAGRDVILRPDVTGKVIDVSPKLLEGGRFEKGEVILRVDPFDYQAAIDELEAEHREATARHAELSANKAMDVMALDLDREQFDLIARDVARYERLSGSRAASEKAFDDAKIALSRQKGTVQQRQQSIRMLDARLQQQDAIIDRLAVAKRRAARNLEETVIKAPFGGVVTEVGAQIGQQLSAGDVIARLIDDQRLDVAFQLSERDFGRLWEEGLIGRDLTARWRLGTVIYGIRARIERVVSTIDPTSGGVTLHAGITENPDGAPLRPGAFVEIEMADRLYKDVTELPASAVFDGDTVYVVVDDHLQAEAVDLIATRGDHVLIDTDIEDGTSVVTSRLTGITEGLKVEVVE